MAEYEKAVREVLSNNGCSFIRHGKGDHDMWHSSINGRSFPVDNKIKSRHVANEIMKQSGIDYRFR
ncbi:MAG: type II toxin-antitoxin system HicA family toxin [Oscillospiraceae bacterium]|nr:type II toxin-antitoxin system HicA family toxin [Oscillospiraceae bacterium]